MGESMFVANHVTYVLMCRETVHKSGISPQVSASAKHGTECIALDCSLQVSLTSVVSLE